MKYSGYLIALLLVVLGFGVYLIAFKTPQAAKTPILEGQKVAKKNHNQPQVTQNQPKTTQKSPQTNIIADLDENSMVQESGNPIETIKLDVNLTDIQPANAPSPENVRTARVDFLIAVLENMHQQILELKRIDNSETLAQRKDQLVEAIEDLKYKVPKHPAGSAEDYFIKACDDLIRFANAIVEKQTSQLLMNFEQSFESNIILAKDQLL